MTRSCTRRSRRWVVVAHALIIGLALSSCRDPAVFEQTPVVVDVLDGDTITVRFDPDVVETVRLLGIDTPETVDPSRPEQCYGAEASAFVRKLLPPGTPVSLERDIEARDHFGRLLAYVRRSSDGTFVNAELLRLGYADLSIYDPNNAYLAAFDHAVTSARTQALGLWGECGGPDVAVEPPPISPGA